MKVLDTADGACRGIEQLCGESFRQRVIAFHLISTDHVVTAIDNHMVELRNLVRRVLKVGIHRDDNVAFC